MSENFISDNYYILVSCFIMAWSTPTEVVEVVCLIKEWDNGNRDNVIKIFKIAQVSMIKTSNKRAFTKIFKGRLHKLTMETSGLHSTTIKSDVIRQHKQQFNTTEKLTTKTKIFTVQDTKRMYA